MTEAYSEQEPEVDSGGGSGGDFKQVAYRATREVYARLLEKYEAGERVNFKEYRRRENYLTTEAAQELTAEEIRRRYGQGYYIVELLEGRTPKDLLFVNIPPRGETVLPAEGGAGRYGRAQPRPARRGNRARRARYGRGSGDSFMREMVERLDRQHAAELARVEEHHRERREEERRHQEEVRRLQEEKQAEVNKRLEERINEAGGRKSEEAPSLQTMFMQYALESIKSGDEETADALVKKALGDEEGAGGFWGFMQGVTRDAFEMARENPHGAMQFVGGIAQKFGLGQQPAATGVTTGAAPQQQPSPSPAPNPTQPLTDMELALGVVKTVGSGIVADVDPAPVAEGLRDVLEERPHLRGQFEGMLEQSDEELLAMISTAARVSFEPLGRKPLKWLRDFRKALKAYGIPAAPAPPIETSSNGASAATVS